MIESILETLSKTHDTIFISGTVQLYETLGYPVIEDLFPGEGPFAALGNFFNKAPHFLLCACDMPFISKEAIEQLWHTFEKTRSPLIYFEQQSKLAPLPGIYSNELESTFQQLMGRGRRDLKALIKETENAVMISEKMWKSLTPNLLKNINTVEEL